MPRNGTNIRWTDEQLSAIARAWGAGSSFREIAETFKTTRSAIAGLVFREGYTRNEGYVKPKRAPYSPKPRPLRVTPPRRPKPILTLPNGDGGHPRPRIRIRRRRDGLVNLYDLNECSCRWPIGDPGTREFGFCPGRNDGSAYCPEHHERAIQGKQ